MSPLICTLFALALSQDPLVTSQEVKLLEAPPGAGHHFGFDVAVRGDRALIGAPHATAGGVDSGAAYLYTRSGTTWTLSQKLSTPGGGGSGDEFGCAVALTNSRALVGARFAEGGFGRAYVYEDQNGNFFHAATLEAPIQDLNSEFGFSVALSGTTACVGAPQEDEPGATDSGSINIFNKVGFNWPIHTRIFSNKDGQQIGWSLALSGDLLITGIPFDDFLGTNQGNVAVFDRVGGLWVQGANIFSNDWTLGDVAGWSVALRGDTAVVGAPGSDLAAQEAGLVTVHVRAPNNYWTQTSLTVADAAVGDKLGRSVDLHDETIVAGAPLDDSGVADGGSAYLFQFDGLNWSEGAELVPGDVGAGDELGVGVAVHRDTVIAGAWMNDEGAVDAGAAYVFRFADAPTSYCTAGTSASGCTASISATGTPSASASSGFVLSAAGVEGDKDGLFFFAANGRQANPWGSGTSFQCVVPPVMRGGLLNGSGTSGACDGTFGQDLLARWAAKPAQNPGPAAVVQAQLWYRDPQNTSNQTTGLSDALEFTLLP